ncbi:MAG: HEAT repeat domain-containing protein, partial [Vicinamibacteria bacterium]
GLVKGERPYEYLTMLIRKRAPGSERAFASLARRRDDARVFDFIAAYLNDPEPGIRYYAAGALGVMDDPRAVPLLEELKNDSDPEVKELAPKLVEKVKRNIEEKNKPPN